MTRPVEAEDILRIRPPSDPQISPDGTHVLFHLRSADLEEKKKNYSHLWMSEVDGGRSRAFTTGKQSDTGGRWSPDGSKIAFIRSTDDGSRIYVMNADGGEPGALTNLEPGAIFSIEWSPGGDRLLMIYRKRPGKDKKPPAVRHITTLNSRFEGLGWFDGLYPHVWVVDAATGKAAQVADGRWGEAEATWSPDGKTIAFTSNRHAEAEYQGEQLDLWTVGAGGGEPKRIATPPGPVYHPRWSGDGRRVAYLGHDDPEACWGTKNLHPWVVPLGGKATNLTPDFDRCGENLTISDMWGFQSGAATLHWSPDDARLFYLISSRGATQLNSARTEAPGEPTPLTEGAHDVRGMTLSRDGRRAALLIATQTNPGTLHTAAVEEPMRPKPLFDPNAELLAGLQVAMPEELTFTSADGTEIQGWLLKPAGFDPKRTYPLCLEIHGGPRAQYGATFFHEFQMLAAQGYVVLYTNPRGSQGYGEKFAAAITGAWGELDYQDIMATVDAVLERGFIDPKKMAVMGGSYGGYMTNWIVGHTDRFACGITMRCVSNLISMEGTSDFGYECRREFGAHAWEDPERLWKMSPAAYAKNVRTPLLIIHGEGDLRCAVEQGEQMYRFLKEQKLETELLIFPEENHDLSRGGRPDRRVLRLEHMLRWLKKYLGS